MARKLRIQVPGFYHIVNRGVERRIVYSEPEDFEFFLSLLGKMKKLFTVNVHAFCLMSNHYHILLETKEENLSKSIHFINDKYARYFNKKYNRSGHLWQGRYKSYYLYDDNHFWIVAKYIERNPMKAKMVNDISSYRFQSFFQWKYKHTFYYLIEDSMIQDMTLSEYEKFITSEFNNEMVDKVYTTPKFIKQDGNIKFLHKRLETFFEFDRDINRNNNIKRAYEYGYSKSDIANFLEISPATVSRIVKNM